MRLLLDTQFLLWVLYEPAKVSPDARSQMEGADLPILFSAASVWEIAIKASLGKADFQFDAAVIAAAAIASNMKERPVDSAAAATVRYLPLHHRDPFDRLLIAQAIHEQATLLTAGKALAVYGEPVSLIR